jgi:hypothetical protein
MKNKGNDRIKTRGHIVLFVGGLYKQRVVELKNRYSRKNKHKGKEDD